MLRASDPEPKVVTAPVYACPVRFWDFALPVAVGSTAGLAASWVAGRLTHAEHPSTRATISAVTHAAAFWLFGGLAWVIKTHRPR